MIFIMLFGAGHTTSITPFVVVFHDTYAPDNVWVRKEFLTKPNPKTILLNGVLPEPARMSTAIHPVIVEIINEDTR